MTDGELDLGIEREGESYRTYNYATKQMSKDLTKDELNGFLRDYDQRREEYAAAERERIESEQKRKNEIAEIDNLARNSVKEYKTLSAPSQSMIRRIFREGRSQGISDSDLAMYARVSAHSGIDIQFDKEATYRGAKEDGSADYADGFYEAAKNRIVVNPEGKRTAERLLIHELDHAIRKGDNAEFRIQNAEFEATKKKIDEKYGESKRNAEYFASYSEEMLTNKHSLEKLLEAEPTLKNKILSFFKGASTDYADVPKLAGAAKKYYRTYKKLFDEFSARNAENNAIEKPLTNMNQEDMSVSDRQYSIVEPFTDDNGKTFENAVLLDTTFFNGLSPRNWGSKLKGYVENRSQNDPFILQIADENGQLQDLVFAKKSDRVKKDGGSEHSALTELYKTTDNLSKLSAIHIDEIIEVSEENNPYYSSENSHGSFDKNGWLHRNANVINAQNGKIYNVTVDIAKTEDGRTVLYATKGKIKKVGQAKVNSLKIRGSTPHSNFKGIISQNNSKINTSTKKSLENSSVKQYALDIDSDSGDISGAEIKPKAKAQPKAKTKAQVRADQVVQNKKIRAEADYTTDKVFSQASVKRNFDKVEAVKKIPTSVREDIARRLWIELEMSEGDEIRDSIALGYSVELFQAIRFADFERIRIKSSKTP